MINLKRILTTLALSAVAALGAGGVMAAAAPAAFAASELCFNTTEPCEKLVPQGTVLEGNQLGSGTLTASSGVKITCTGSKFEDEVTSNKAGGATVGDSLSKLTFSGCTESVFKTACTATTTASTTAPWATVLAWTKDTKLGPNGTIEVQTVKAKVECPTLKVTCEYEGAEGVHKGVFGELFNANDTNKPVEPNTHSEVRFNEVALTSLTGGSTCGAANAKEKVVYEVTDKGENVYLVS